MFNNNKYLATFLLIHLLDNSVAGSSAVDIVETLSWFGCCVNSKQTMVFNQEDIFLNEVLRQE